jgi:hypothetical protein
MRTAALKQSRADFTAPQQRILDGLIGYGRGDEWMPWPPWLRAQTAQALERRGLVEFRRDPIPIDVLSGPDTRQVRLTPVGVEIVGGWRRAELGAGS